MTQGLVTLFIAVLAGTLSLILAIVAINLWLGRRSGSRLENGRVQIDQSLQPIIFLFRDRRLIDATAPARMLLKGVSGSDDDWSRLAAWIEARFEGAIAGISDPEISDRIELSSGTDSAALRLLAEPLDDGLLRITLTDPKAAHSGVIVDALAQQALEEEVEMLRNALDQTPMLVWQQDGDGRINWANGAYIRRAEAVGDHLDWPLPRLFEAGAGVSGRRARLDIGGAVHWYDCNGFKMGDQTMMFALPADAAVRAERSLREFVQTLTKTFADLPIGLAIFDRDRRLQLFNPALIDLTGLPTGFLTARPTLFDLLDRLREMRMVPEPKDFRSWRQQMNNLEAAAATGHHVETWSLPGGQIYRVTGRPHPDGAVAFLFEDITSEISLARKFRAEMLLGAHVLDGIEDALIVFGADGQQVLCNRAYEDLWGGKSATLTEAVALWENRIEDAGAGFSALRVRLMGTGEETVRDNGAMTAPGGGLLSWTVGNLSGGRQMVRFRLPQDQNRGAALAKETGFTEMQVNPVDVSHSLAAG